VGQKALTSGVLLAALLMISPGAPPAHAAAPFTVNTASDFADINVGDGVCDADAAIGQLCTLRAAIEESNATTGTADAIHFDILGSGVKTISPSTNLPNIIAP
jgi:hypothetical protein